MQISIIRLTTSRAAYFLAHSLTGTFLLLLAVWLYLHSAWHQEFLGTEGLASLQTLAVGMGIILWLDGLYKLLFVRALPQTNMLLIFKYVFRLGGKSIWWDAPTRTAFLTVALEFFFIPIMLGVVMSNGRSLLSDARYMLLGSLDVSFDNVYAMLVAAIFFLDTLVFLCGYIFAAKFLNNTIKSVDPTLFGWMIALCTYPPFNSYTAQVFPMLQNGFTPLAESPLLLVVIRLLILVCHFFFLAATLSLGTKASNLTSRGVVTSGMYGVVRHPAYTAKLSAWLLTGFIFASSTTYFISWAGFAIIYTLRALTEEWHLESDPDYIEYKKVVKYRFIPKVV